MAKLDTKELFKGYSTDPPHQQVMTMAWRALDLFGKPPQRLGKIWSYGHVNLGRVRVWNNDGSFIIKLDGEEVFFYASGGRRKDQGWGRDDLVRACYHELQKSLVLDDLADA